MRTIITPAHQPTQSVEESAVASLPEASLNDPFAVRIPAEQSLHSEVS